MTSGITSTDTMFSVRQMPWHGLGTVLDAPPTIDEALEVAGLSWTALLEPAYTARPVDTRPLEEELAALGASPDDITRIVALLPTLTIGDQLDTRVVRRSDIGTRIGEVGKGFRPLQNKDAFGWFAPLIDEGVVTLETAGSLFGGSRVWIMARLAAPPVEVAPGDAIEPYLLLSHGHDGRLAIRGGLTPVRVVCNNTLTAALDDEEGAGGSLFTVKHTRHAGAMLADARTAIEREIGVFRAAGEGWSFLAGTPAYDDDLDRYVRLVFGTGEVGDDESEDATPPAPGGAGSRVLAKIYQLWADGRGARPGTWWAAYNAVTEYLSHERGADAGRRFAALHFGEGRRLNGRALSLALDLARHARGL